MAPHSSTFAWKIPWMEEPGGLQSMGSLESNMTGRHHFHFSLSCIGEGNGNPLQCSCLETPRDGGAWWAAVYGVAQSRTRLKQLSSSSSSLYLVTPSPILPHPLFLSLLVTTSFFVYVCESISVLLYSSISFIFQIPCISDLIQYLSFSA